MKTRTFPRRLFCVTCAALLMAAAPAAVLADENEKKGAPATGDTFTGTVVSFDDREKTVTVKKLLMRRTFNIADSCSFTVGNRKVAKLRDLRRGQQANITYENADGVYIARRIEQPNLQVTGLVKAVDLDKHEVRIGNGTAGKTFALAENCKLISRGSEADKLSDLKVGDRITVVYDIIDGSNVAERLERNTTTFEGTITAMDISDRTVKIKNLLSHRKFNLADGYRVFVDGKREASLRDLKLGQKVTISYEELEGVNVAYRLAANVARHAEKAEPTKTSKLETNEDP